MPTTIPAPPTTGSLCISIFFISFLWIVDQLQACDQAKWKQVDVDTASQETTLLACKQTSQEGLGNVQSLVKIPVT
jgi:hypothetical protein